MKVSDKAFEKRESAGIMYSLDRMEALMEELGQPQNRCPVIHVAGTNGKGTVVTFIDRLIHEEGRKTAAFMTPSPGERHEQLTSGGRPVSSGLFEEAVNLVLPAVEKVEEARGETISSFELLTAVVFTAAAELIKPEILIIEAGMGGRLDATNVVRKPEATVITSVGTDHAEFLGHTREAVAREKAGIMRPEVPCISACDEEADEWLRQEAERIGAVWTPLPDDWTFTEPDLFTWRGETAWLPIPGKHQARNARAALAASEIFVKPKLSSLEKAEQPGRWEAFGPGIILDTAHNKEAVEALCDTAARYPRVSFLTAVMRDKPVHQIVETMQQLGEVTAAGMPDERGMTQEEWEKEFPGLPFTGDPHAWIREKQRKLKYQELLIVTGSHAFIRFIKNPE